MYTLSNKHDQWLDLYLDSINHSLDEKFPILSTILENIKLDDKLTKTYLEIWVWQGPIKKIISSIPAKANMKIIWCDIDPEVINYNIKDPFFFKYFKKKQWIKVEFLQTNGMDLPFENNSIDWINASSVLHEIFSYSWWFKWIDRFFQQCNKVLKIGGVVWYRDLLYKNQDTNFAIYEIVDKPLKLFINIFIWKFILQPSNFNLVFHPDSILITYKNINWKNYTKNIPDFQKVSTKEIDFLWKFMIYSPHILWKEIERHYIIFLSEFNPYHLAIQLCEKNIKVDEKTLFKIKNKSNNLFESLHCNSFKAPLLKIISKTINGKLERWKVSYWDKMVLWGKEQQIDIKDLYYNICEKYSIESVSDDDIKDLLKRWRSEWEESYFYLSPNELINRVAQVSYNETDQTILFPIQYQEIEREKYSSLFKGVINRSNKYIPKDWKVVIVFKKISILDLKHIYKNTTKEIQRIYQTTNMVIN